MEILYNLIVLSLWMIRGFDGQTITISPIPATVTENQNLELTCSLDHDGTCPYLAWERNSIAVVAVRNSGGTCTIAAGSYSSSLFSCSSPGGNICEYQLTIEDVQTSQNGNKWKCTAVSVSSAETEIKVTAQTPCSCKCEAIAVASIVVACVGVCLEIGAIVAIFDSIKTLKVVIAVCAGGVLEIFAFIFLVVSTQTASDCCELQECEIASIVMICVGVVIAICAICLAIFRSKPGTIDEVEIGPPGIPVILTENNVDTSTSILVRWSKPSTGGSKILKYSVKYQKVSVKQATAENQNKGYELLSIIDTEETIDSIKNKKHELSNLLPGSYYQVTVIAHNINGSSNPGSKIIKTPEVDCFGIDETGKSSTGHGKSNSDSPKTARPLPEKPKPGEVPGKKQDLAPIKKV